MSYTTAAEEKVDQMINKVIEAGGREFIVLQDHGWMYGRSFQDIDGHLWEIIHKDNSVACVDQFSTFLHNKGERLTLCLCMVDQVKCKFAAGTKFI